MKPPRRDRRRGVPSVGRPESESYRSARSVLRDLAGDPAYLECKERMGEPLTASERFALELARAGAAKPEGEVPP